MSLPVKLYPPSLPPNYCITDLQSFVNTIFAQGRGEITTTSSIAKIIVDDAAPGPNQRDYIWVRELDGTIEGVYEYKSGAWVRPHEVSPSSPKREIYVGASADIATYDGGDTSAAGEASGPMWQIDTAMAGRFPLGAGTLPSTTVIGNGTTGGNETVPIAKANLPTNTLYVKTDITGNSGVTGGVGSAVCGQAYGSDPVTGNAQAVDATNTSGGLGGCYKTRGQTEPMGDGTNLNVMPPYYGVYFLVRTTRKYRVAT